MSSSAAHPTNNAETADLATTPVESSGGVAPPQLFASPFLAEHERAIVSVLKLVHPSLKISRATLTILQRFTDRLAHYLLHRAYHGLNGGMSAAAPSASSASSAPADSSASSVAAPAAAAAASTPSEPVDPFSIDFAFDAPLLSALGELRLHSVGERSRAVCKLRESGEVNEAGWTAMTVANNNGFFLPSVLAERWMQDFALGLRLTDEDAVLPPSLQSVEQKLSLCAIIEYLLAELLELSGNATNQQLGRSVVQLRSLWLVMESDTELRALAAFLPVDWTIDTKRAESPLDLACASQKHDQKRHALRVLEAAFDPHTAAQAELNRSSWYHDPVAVIDAARMAARGQLVESPLSRQLREAHVRPIRFWGVSEPVPPDLNAAWKAAGFRSQYSQRARRVAVVSFSLADAHGRDSAFLLCDSAGGSSAPMTFAVDPSQTIPFRTNPVDAILAAYQPRDREATGVGPVEEPAKEVERASQAAAPLLKFSLLGPTLFAENHPPQMRRLFTAHLIDSCMLESGLRPLPLVLSELISEFHSFDLPFRQDKATEQMRQAGLKPQEQDSRKATYVGQLDSAVERVCDVEAMLDRIFPVVDSDDDEDDEEDEEEEEA